VVVNKVEVGAAIVDVATVEIATVAAVVGSLRVQQPPVVAKASSMSAAIRKTAIVNINPAVETAVHMDVF
jgi:hypothetical protein